MKGRLLWVIVGGMVIIAGFPSNENRLKGPLLCLGLPLDANLGTQAKILSFIVFAVDSTSTTCTGLFTLSRNKLQNSTLIVPLAESSV